MTYELKRSLHDSRDIIYKQESGVPLTTQVDLREWDSIVEDQGDLGSCEGAALTNAYELMVKKEHPEKYVALSSLFVYYNSRLIEGAGLVNEDTGAYIRNGLKSLQKYGVCSDKLWPYKIDKFDDKPTRECYEDALSRTIGKYELLRTNTDVLHVLNSKKPVVIGMEIYEKFYDLNRMNSVIQMPKDYEKSLGGHAMCLVGYSLKYQQFLAKNSYGTDWGNQGYCWIPFDYLSEYGWERWSFDIDQKIIT
jgi:C1A family cysteine protease